MILPVTQFLAIPSPSERTPKADPMLPPPLGSAEPGGVTHHHQERWTASAEPSFDRTRSVSLPTSAFEDLCSQRRDLLKRPCPHPRCQGKSPHALSRQERGGAFSASSRPSAHPCFIVVESRWDGAKTGRKGYIAPERYSVCLWPAIEKRKTDCDGRDSGS